jgi:ABC-type glycerol-3-phosphate transport system substrate-binding protein
MKVGRRYAILLAVVAAAALALLGARATPAAHAGAKASKLTIWVDNVQKPAIDKVASAWGTKHGVDVNVVFHSFGQIRDDLKTVKAENAPDVIVAAHDWTGDLAANGLVLPLFPKKATKAQFPKYALDAFSYGGRLYGAPYALENVGLVVNTRLVKVPKTWAQLEKEALAFKKKDANNIGIAVPQGSAGDAYHMYPFFSGLGGYVFGRTKNGALQANKLGVANPIFLKNAPLIDKWNREGLINSKIDYGTAKNAWLKGNAAFWITGPWEVDSLKASGNPFPHRPAAEDQVPLGAVPRRAGHDGHEVRADARRHEPRKGPRRQRDDEAELPARPRAGQPPLPGEQGGGQAGQRPDPEAVRGSRRRRCADAEHPADGQRLGRARRCLGQRDEGRGCDSGPHGVLDGSEKHPQQDRGRLIHARV